MRLIKITGLLDDIGHRRRVKAAKAIGIKLGNPQWQGSIEAARGIRSANAAKHLKMVAPTIEGLRSSGITTLTGLENALNERGIQTAQSRRWHPMTVKRAIEAMS